MRTLRREDITFAANGGGLVNHIYRLAYTLFEYKAAEVNASVQHDEKDKGYKCIHSAVERFVEVLYQTLESEKIDLASCPNMKFLDVGCGVGQKVYLANLFGFQSFGLEFREKMVDVAYSLLNGLLYGNHRNKIIHRDALTFHGYGDFDVIYFYCPIKDEPLQIELEKRIARDAKIGTILIPFLPKFFTDRWNKEGRNIGRHVNGWKDCNGGLYWKKTGACSV